MARRRTVRMLMLGAAVASALAAAPARAFAEDAPAGAQPFPVTKSTTLRGAGNVWVIDGPTVIPKNVEIGVELDTSIVGINGASLDVQGGLKVRGTVDHWVKIENVDFSPTRSSLRGVHLDMVDLVKCRFVHNEGVPFAGSFVIENACIQRDCAFDFRISAGHLKIMTTTWGVPCTIRCEAPEGKRPDIMIHLRSSLLRETMLHGHGEITLRHSEVRGGVTAQNMLDLMIDGCDISQKLVLKQAPEESLKKIKLTKCNLWSGTVVEVQRPAADNQKMERVFLQKFFFGGKDGSDVIMDPKVRAALARIEGPKVGVRWDKPRKRKHILVNYDLLETRVPRLRGSDSH